MWSSGNTVTYHVDGMVYQEEYEEGQSVLSPTVVTPSLSGAAFLGWSASADSADVLSSLAMGDVPVSLYAVFKYADVTYPRAAYAYQTICDVNQLSGNSDVSVAVKGIPSINTDIYSKISVNFSGTYNGGANFIKINSGGANYRILNAYFNCGSNLKSIGSISTTGEEQTMDIMSTTIDIPLSMQGMHTLFLRGILSGGNGFCSGQVIIGNTSSASSSPLITLTGRTVVG